MQKNDVIIENKMGTMSIRRLLFTISMPMIISMIVQALYNVVDSIFVARLGEEALTALSLAFPIQNLMIAAAVGTGVGFNALISKSLGEQNMEKGHKVAQHGQFLTFINALIFVAIGLGFSRFFFESQTDNELIIEYGVEYMRIITMFSVGLFFQVTFERYLQATGKTHLSMIVQIVGAGINIALDPILIFGLFGFPALEVAGAAIATVVGQSIAAIVGLILCVRCNKEVNINMKGFRINKNIISSILAIAFPVIVMQSIGSVMIYGINNIIISASVSAAAVFGIYFRLQSFIFLPIFGLNNGLVSIVAYNYGAKNKERIIRSIKLATIVSVTIMSVGSIIFILFPKQLLLLFDANPQMIEVGVVALRVLGIGFPLAGISIIVSGPFQAMGYSVASLIISIVRQLVAILPLAYLFTKLWGIDGTWLAFPISEIVALILTIVYFKRMYRKVIMPLGEE